MGLSSFRASAVLHCACTLGRWCRPAHAHLGAVPPCTCIVGRQCPMLCGSMHGMNFSTVPAQPGPKENNLPATTGTNLPWPTHRQNNMEIYVDACGCWERRGKTIGKRVTRGPNKYGHIRRCARQHAAACLSIDCLCFLFKAMCRPGIVRRGVDLVEKSMV